ncbi:hypothetical protein PPERSA_07326 [Pseudocohnilembus persalinus]|uniref:Uncharacterized protein n=1 Tax=Pseudocohnilembus persalinus TaxID=266149 RepID=A0A0V0R6W8_PSEPJ|nr:hypothetical protein PPERSA_07326 [Pseudocohnilembus persalinus]|eukprot:KRX10241.1 hypothetical protein PPERSA_07326 [Pseudocohnilembus persalinus]
MKIQINNFLKDSDDQTFSDLDSDNSSNFEQELSETHKSDYDTWNSLTKNQDENQPNLQDSTFNKIKEVQKNSEEYDDSQKIQSIQNMEQVLSKKKNSSSKRSQLNFLIQQI